ncbi:hypothetical protein [Thiolapillus sp.]|uniref:hypothetical protein n=1 Tax=Thiolapillus sp. TaxID=2017437 RepID=UPI003AF581D1
MGQDYRKTMLYPQKDNQIPFPQASGNSAEIDGFFNSLLTVMAHDDATPDHGKTAVRRSDFGPTQGGWLSG